MKRGPIVSVCVPTFNGAAHLGETLGSIAAQTLDDHEVIVVDDGSTDGTLDVAEAHAARDARVRVYRNRERAGSSARNANRCLPHARGEWIKFLFQDDLMAPTGLEQMLAAGAHGRLVIAWHGYLFGPEVDADTRGYYEGLPTLEQNLTAPHAEASALCDAVRRHWLVNFIGPTSTSFIHRSCFDDHGVFSAEITAFPDLEYWIRVGNQEGIAILPERVITFRVHERSVSGGMRREAGTGSRRTLDPLLLLLLIAREPEYAHFRERARQHVPTMDIDAMLIAHAVEERRLAEDARYRRRDDALLRKWTDFCDRHPAIPALLQQVDARSPLWSRVKRYLKARL